MSRLTQTTGPHSLRRRRPLAIALTVASLAVGALDSAAAGAEVSSVGRWWSEAVEQALTQAGTNRAGLSTALSAAPVPQREGLQFLLENMPRPDLESLSAAFLLDNLALAYQAREEAPWGKGLSDEIFLNDVLPYASVNERRDAWRKTLHEICAPLVNDCQTPGAAAQVLNQKLFALVKVRYSTERKRADQSPLETMESGKATCTGLSILLVDACRSVGVPARVAGTPLWVNLRGNHTWVEVWDQAGTSPAPRSRTRQGWIAAGSAMMPRRRSATRLGTPSTPAVSSGPGWRFPWCGRGPWIGSAP
ncbi:MAG: transglutaminase domain-containing protein [Verrucomicrobia bacterium]|nr:transglutaminase domain-containing protein [Verrucomicrobiota bacterium]